MNDEDPICLPTYRVPMLTNTKISRVSIERDFVRAFIVILTSPQNIECMIGRVVIAQDNLKWAIILRKHGPYGFFCDIRLIVGNDDNRN